MNNKLTVQTEYTYISYIYTYISYNLVGNHSNVLHLLVIIGTF